MPDNQRGFNAILATTQSLFTVLRDLFLVILFVVLLCFPTQLNSVLTKAGISQLNGGIFTWQQQAKQAAAQSTAAAQANSAASDSLSDVKSALEAIASQSKDPAIKKQATDAANQAAGSITSLDSANSSLARSVLTQDSMAHSSGPGTESTTSASATQGWVFVGKSDPTHQHWAAIPKPKIDTASPAVTVGQVVTFTDDIFLRADKAQNQTFNRAAILGAVRAGDTATIIDLQFSHALAGGDFVWVKVAVKGGQ
jgi:hypothetical protein